MIPQRDTMGRLVTAGLALLAPPAAAQPTPAASPAPAPRWTLRVSASGDWYDNAYFVGGDSESTLSTNARASLTHERGFRHGSFSLGGYGGVLYYPAEEGLDQAVYGGNLGLSWAPSPRTLIHFGQTYDRTNTRQLPPTDPQGPPLPTSGLDTATSTLGLTHGLSHRWQLGVDGAFTWRQYDAAALVGGRQLDATAQLSRVLGRHDAAYVSYEYSSAWLEPARTGTHVFLAGGRRRKEKGVSFELGGGAGYVERVARWYPAGLAGLTARGRRASLALSYDRDFGQAFGYGRDTVNDTATATFGWTAARHLTLSAGCTLGYRRDPVVEDYTIRSLVASTGLVWQITKELGIGAGYSRERNETSGLETIDSNRVTVSVSYGRNWR